MIIYIVTASEGFYDEYHQWNVRGFISEILAQQWIDAQWDKFENDRYTLEKKALGEIQTKPPNADLSVSPDFHGYCIQALTVEGY